MTSVVRPPAPIEALREVISAISHQRFSMSVEMLRQVEDSLYIARALVDEVLNTRCAIDKLPPEILSHIFSLIPPSLLPSDSTRYTARNTYDLLPLTHVCRRWRQIALATSTLWSTVCETSPTHGASHLFRARARNTPLTVYVDRPYASVALAEILATHGQNVVELHLRGLQETSAVHLASDLLAFPAPRLEHATVRSRANMHHASDGQSTAGVGPLVELWKGKAPRLMTLELFDLPFLPSNEFACLRKLTLSFGAAHVEWTLSDLLGVLSRVPMLEHLFLRGLPSALLLPHTSKMLNAAITLPCLRSIEIGDRPGRSCSLPLIHLLLSRLTLPSGTSVRLFGINACRILGPPDFPGFPTGDELRLAVDVSFCTMALAAVDPRTSSSLRVELSTGGATREALEFAIEGFLRGREALREVIISSQRRWTTWCDPARLLAMLPRVTSLEVRDTILVAPLLGALRPRTPTILGEGQPRPSYEALACWELRMLRIPLPIPFPEENTVMELLASILVGRARPGAGLQIICSEREKTSRSITITLEDMGILRTASR